MLKSREKQENRRDLIDVLARNKLLIPVCQPLPFPDLAEVTSVSIPGVQISHADFSQNLRIMKHASAIDSHIQALEHQHQNSVFCDTTGNLIWVRTNAKEFFHDRRGWSIRRYHFTARHVTSQLQQCYRCSLKHKMHA